MEYSRRDIGKGIGLNIINTDKFKTILISLSLIRPLTQEEASLNALLPLVLKRGTIKNKTYKEIQRKLDELYGANLSIDVNKKGEKQIVRFTIEGIDSIYLEEKNYITKLIEFLLEILLNPLIEDGSFVEEYVEQEKKNLINRIKGLKNDKKHYAFERAIEEICRGEKYSIYKFGDIDNVKKINKDKLYRHYKTILENSPIEITVVGKSTNFDIEEIIKKSFNFSRNAIVNIPREDIYNKKSCDINEIFEKMNVSQGKLILGYRINIPYENKLFDAFLIANEILGGGPNSKLFISVRERESLAYYVYSQVIKYKSIMLISSGIEIENYKKAKEIIINQIQELSKGNFTDDDISDAKNAITTAIKSLQDNNYSIADFYLSNIISNDRRSFDDYVSSIMNVKREDIIDSCKKLKLDTIYFLTNEATKEDITKE